MTGPDDIAAAARRVAAQTRNDGARTTAGPTLLDDLLALLPIFDAVAKGPDDDRVERWARLLAHQHFDRKRWVGVCPKSERTKWLVDEYWQHWWAEARAAIALADAEVAARQGSDV